jgi:transcriptional regulator with XRE-family HTH domain
MNTQYLVFARNLKYLRKKNELTQSELRSEFNISAVTWVRYEKGLSPSLPLIVEVAAFFNLSVEDLLFKDLQEAEDTKEQDQKKKNGKQKINQSLFLSKANVPFDEEKIILRHLLWEVKKMNEEIQHLLIEIRELKNSQMITSIGEPYNHA